MGSFFGGTQDLEQLWNSYALWICWWWLFRHVEASLQVCPVFCYRPRGLTCHRSWFCATYHAGDRTVERTNFCDGYCCVHSVHQQTWRLLLRMAINLFYDILTLYFIMFGGLFLLQTNIPVSSRPCSDDAMSEWSPWGTPVLWVIPQAPVLSFFIKNSPLPGPSEVPRSPDRYPIISPYFPICFSINYKNSPTWKNVRPFEDDSTIMSTIPVISIFPESLIDRHITTGMMYQWYPQLWCLYNLCIYIYIFV